MLTLLPIGIFESFQRPCFTTATVTLETDPLLRLQDLFYSSAADPPLNILGSDVYDGLAA